MSSMVLTIASYEIFLLFKLALFWGHSYLGSPLVAIWKARNWPNTLKLSFLFMKHFSPRHQIDSIVLVFGIVLSLSLSVCPSVDHGHFLNSISRSYGNGYLHQDVGALALGHITTTKRKKCVKIPYFGVDSKIYRPQVEWNMPGLRTSPPPSRRSIPGLWIVKSSKVPPAWVCHITCGDMLVGSRWRLRWVFLRLLLFWVWGEVPTRWSEIYLYIPCPVFSGICDYYSFSRHSDTICVSDAIEMSSWLKKKENQGSIREMSESRCHYYQRSTS